MPTLRHTAIRTITRLYPLYSGLGSIANSPLLKFVAGADGTETFCRVGGGEVWVDLADWVGRAAYFFGDLDRKISWVCRRIVQDGDTVLDIGANIGVVSVLLARCVGAKGVVHSFEPNPRLVEVLNKVVDRNGLRNMRIHAVALGERVEQLDLVVPPGNAGMGSLIREQATSATTVHRVEVLPLDQVAEREGVGNIRLIKIDVEGFEEMVFKGAYKVLSSIRPDAILFELNRRTADSLKDEPMIKMLAGFDYEFFAIPKCLFRMRVQRIDLDAPDKCDAHDFLASPKGATYENVARRLRASA